MTKENTDDNLLQQVDDLLDHGYTSDHAVINELASTLPEADLDFQQQLEERLVAQLEQKMRPKKEEVYHNLTSITPMTRRKSTSFPYARWVAVVVMILAGAYLIKLYQEGDIETAIPLPADAREHHVVVAAKYITEGDYITPSMVDTLTLDAALFTKLQYSHPGETFYSDPLQVVGQRAVVALNPLEPFLPATLGMDMCPVNRAACEVKEIFDIIVPMPDIEMEKFGLSVGERVNVYVDINNQYPIIQDVVLSDIQRDTITLSGSAWKIALLRWHLRIEDKSYFLRSHIDNKAAGWNDQTLVEYSLRTLTPLDESGRFFLYVYLPLNEAYALQDVPVTMEAAKNWISNNRLEFPFEKAQLVRRESDATFVLRMPQADAHNLEYLLRIGDELMVGQAAPGADTPAPTSEAALPVEPTALPEGEICPQGLSYCVPLPDLYQRISLPAANFTSGETLNPGDRVDVLGEINNETVVVAKYVLLMGETTDFIHLAGPSWKSVVLAWFSRQNQLFTLRATAYTPAERVDTLVQVTIQAPEVLPDDYQFDLVVRFPEAEGYRLNDLPYSLSQIPFTANGNTMSFWFKTLRPVSIDGTAVTIELPASDAENLTALIELGAALGFQPDANPPTATPTSLAGGIPQGRVAITLPVMDLPLNADQMDVIVNVPDSNISMSEEDREKIVDTEHFRIHNGLWEFRFVDMVVLSASEAADPTVDERAVTFHVTPEDATALQYLMEIGGEVQFAPRLDEAVSVSPIGATPIAEPSSAEPEVCMEHMLCRKNLPFYKIELPRTDFILEDEVSEGTQVTIASSSQEIRIEDVVLIAIRDESLTVAAPAWKYSLLEQLPLQTYTISPFDGVRDTEVVDPLTPTTMEFTTSEYVPEKFTLMVKLPLTRLSRLLDLPYYGIRSSFQNGVLTFSFPDIETVSQTSDASYVIRLPAGAAANLAYLLSLGADIDVYMEERYLPTPDMSALPILTPTPMAPVSGEAVPEFTGPIQPRIENRPCPAEANFCVTVPDHYSQIQLPIPRVPATGLWFNVGDRVNLWLHPNDPERIVVENVLFVGTEMDTLIFAAPAWKYSILFLFSGSTTPSEYTMRPFDITQGPTIFMPEEGITQKFPISVELPDTFGLTVKVPIAEIRGLAEYAYVFDLVRSSIKDGALIFLFPSIETVSKNADGTYIIHLPTGEAAALDYLVTHGGEMTVTPPEDRLITVTPLPTWTPSPVATEIPDLPKGEVIIPQDRMALVLPAHDALPGERFDVIVSLERDQTELLAEMTYSYNHILFQSNINTWDLRLTDVELVSVQPPEGSEGETDETLVTVHVRRADATILQHLIDHGAAVRFVVEETP